MTDEPDPGDALRQLLQERERAKKAVYAAHMAREKAEEELAHREKLFQMQIDETQKLASENADLRARTEKSQVVIQAGNQEVETQKTRAEKAEKRVGILETILSRVESEIYNAIEEEDEFDPLEDLEGIPNLRRVPNLEPTDVAKDEDADPASFGDYTEDMRQEGLTTMPFANFGVTPGRAIVAAARIIYRHWRVASLVVAAPFALMTLALALASYGVYIDALRPLWSPWPDDSTKWVIGSLGTFVFTFPPLLRARKKPVVAPEESLAKSATEEDEYFQTLKKFFGDDDDEEIFEGDDDKDAK